nr:MAG TPA: Protein of unknown function (DUF1642) [Caudoviricetes sp.]
MNIQGLIERYEKFKASKKKMTSVDLVLKDLRSLDEPEPLPFKLKDVVGRIRGFDPTTQARWLNGILKELGDDYGSMKYREGYEQGKLEGAWVGNQLKDADKIRCELNKVKVPKLIADYIEYAKKEDYHILGAMSEVRKHENKDIADWFYTDDNIEIFARAWFDGYEVEKEKRYEVILCNGQSLKTVYRQGSDHLDFKMVYGDLESFTRKQLEEVNFGWVLDCPGIEIEEVTE